MNSTSKDIASRIVCLSLTKSKLAQDLKKVHPRITMLRQGKTKDIDDLLKSEYRESVIRQLSKARDCNASFFTLEV